MVSLFSERSAIEHIQANQFVDVFHHSQLGTQAHIWRVVHRLSMMR
jgi:hypothetical protein